MKIKSSFISLLAKSLCDSLTIDMLESIARELMPGYDIHDATGYPYNIPVPKQDAARQISNDLRSKNLIPQLLSLMIKIHTRGYMGRTFRFNHLKDIIREINSQGFIFDRETGMFLEDPDKRMTNNWGVLRHGQEYLFTFLRLDIAGNSRLVRKYPEATIKKTYSDLNSIVSKSIASRNGRLWNWEGDGGLAAFFFGNKNHSAVLSGMEILHDLFLYNELECKLEKPLEIRIGLHTGPVEFTDNMEEIKKHDTIKKVIEIEENHTGHNSMTLSDEVKKNLDELITDQLNHISINRNTNYYEYTLRWEEK